MIKLGWMEKWTLRFAVVALLFLALSGFEGMLMRTQQYDINSLHGMETFLNSIRPGDIEPTTPELYYAMLTAHPIVGIYGFVYMAVFGAFYFLVPYLINKPVKHPKLVVDQLLAADRRRDDLLGSRLLRTVQRAVHALLAAAGFI